MAEDLLFVMRHPPVMTWKQKEEYLRGKKKRKVAVRQEQHKFSFQYGFVDLLPFESYNKITNLILNVPIGK